MTSDQQEPSANNPWTSTTLRAFGVAARAGAMPAAAPVAASIPTNWRRSI